MGGAVFFAGVIAFIYADLIVPQLIRIYRKIFGNEIGTKLSVILFLSMAAAGFAVFYLFDFVGLVPSIRETTAREGVTIFGLSPRTILNVVFLGVAAVFAGVLYKGKKKAPGDRVVRDPVTGTEMTAAEADYCTVHEETIYYFESEDSREQFRRDKENFLEE